jgi:hypothetical protein
MPIFIDSSEIRSSTTLPDIPDAIVISNLSKLIGGDWLLSTLKVRPKTARLVQKHISAGGLIVECKRMDAGLLRWEGLASNREIPFWISAKLRHLTEYKTQPIKVLHKKPSKVSQDRVLRELRVVDDARNVLIALGDLFGPAKSAAIMEHCGNSLAWAFEFLSDVNNAGVIRGIGKKAIEQFRYRMGFEGNTGIKVVGMPNVVCWSCGVMYWDEDVCRVCGESNGE